MHTKHNKLNTYNIITLNNLMLRFSKGRLTILGHVEMPNYESSPLHHLGLVTWDYGTDSLVLKTGFIGP